MVSDFFLEFLLLDLVEMTLLQNVLVMCEPNGIHLILKIQLTIRYLFSFKRVSSSAVLIR